MSLRKIAGLLITGGLAVGLIGSGVGAQFTDGVKADGNITIGNFACAITAATPLTATLLPAAGPYKSVTYPVVVTSSTGTAPLTFTVQNTGDIDATLTVTPPTVGSGWSVLGSFAPLTLAHGASTTISTGVSWSDLGNDSLNYTGTVEWTVSCNG
jgi:hypothetical protein